MAGYEYESETAVSQPGNGATSLLGRESVSGQSADGRLRSADGAGEGADAGAVSNSGGRTGVETAADESAAIRVRVRRQHPGQRRRHGGCDRRHQLSAGRLDIQGATKTKCRK